MPNKQRLATFIVAFFMAGCIGVVAPTLDYRDERINAANQLMQSKQVEADKETTRVIQAYSNMSDEERLRGVVYE